MAQDTTTGRAAAQSWDWKGQPDLDLLARQLHELTDGRLTLHQVDDGTDNVNILITDAPLTDIEASNAFIRATETPNSGPVIDL